MSAQRSSTGEWSECFSNKYQQKYWFNSATNESVWVDPNSTLKDNLLTTTNGQTKQTTSSIIIHEDSPIVANERDRYAEKCLDILTNENLKYGEMRGNTKTAKSCRQDGMKIGMYGIYARVIWSQLLNQVVTVGDVGSEVRDSIFPTAIMRDEAVEKEFIDASRTPQQARDILNKLGQALVDASANLVQLGAVNRSSMSSIQIELSIDNGSVSGSNKRKLTTDNEVITAIELHLVYNLRYGEVTHSISGSHFAKLLRLYRLHTDPATAVTNPVFVSCSGIF